MFECFVSEHNLPASIIQPYGCGIRAHAVFKVKATFRSHENDE